MVKVWNSGATAYEYVEVAVNKSQLNKNSQSIIGYSVNASVFSHDILFDELVDLWKGFETEEDAVAYAEKVAEEYGLKEDPGLMRRKLIFSLL